jgi:hypothetical protein
MGYSIRENNMIFQNITLLIDITTDRLNIKLKNTKQLLGQIPKQIIAKHAAIEFKIYSEVEIHNVLQVYKQRKINNAATAKFLAPLRLKTP